MRASFEGDFEGFKKALGNAYFCNVLAYLTRRHEHKRNKACEGIPSVHESHKFDGNITLAHPYGAERHDILKELLAPYTDSSGWIRADIFAIEEKFIRIHEKMIADGSCRFLCPTGNALWGSKPRDPTDTTDLGPVVINGEVTLEKLQVELIFQRLTNDQVLAAVQKVFPGRGTMNTVAYYRSRLMHDKSPKFEKLRVGRAVPSARGRG